MESGSENQDIILPKSLKQQLALAVKSIDWSYGIFWSISASQPGVLEWCDGYYNGEIKTRKTVQSVEFNADKLGFQRSEQLRELYESLSASESSGQIRRPSAALSPEDLTNTEWYYLVCMSFSFDIGQGLPGRALSTGQSIWLCNAHYADSKVFSRSLLAKSASIQTVVCFPFLQGVVEFGVTDLVSEDSSIIQHVKASLLETPNMRSSMKYYHDILKTEMIPVVDELELVSPTTSSNGVEAYQPPNESLVVVGTNVAACQAQTLQFMDDEFGNCLHHTVNSSHCISQTFINPQNTIQLLLDKDEMKGNKNELGLTVEDDDFHYQGILSSLLKTSKEFIFAPNLEMVKRQSSFRTWKNGGSAVCDKSSSGTQQRMLKSILFEVPWMHERGLTESPTESTIKNNGVWKPEADEITLNHVLEERRGEKLNERFCALKSIIPSTSKVDRVSILDNTIEYLKTLERRVEELERTELEETLKRKLIHDTSERTCDNYGGSMLRNGKRPLINKRKALEIDQMELEINYDDNLLVSIEDREVVIQMKCKWREGLLLEIINTARNLRLDSHSVQSSTTDGILSLAMKSKFVGLASPSARMIRRAMQRFAQKGS